APCVSRSGANRTSDTHAARSAAHRAGIHLALPRRTAAPIAAGFRTDGTGYRRVAPAERGTRCTRATAGHGQGRRCGTRIRRCPGDRLRSGGRGRRPDSGQARHPRTCPRPARRELRPQRAFSYRPLPARRPQWPAANPRRSHARTFSRSETGGDRALRRTRTTTRLRRQLQMRRPRYQSVRGDRQRGPECPDRPAADRAGAVAARSRPGPAVMKAGGDRYTACSNPPLIEGIMSAISQPHDESLQQRLEAAIAQVNRVLLGKPHQVKLAFTCLIAGGHLLLEDVPGVGKTTLAHALAATFALDFQRVQFTSDLLPSDIIGVSVYERETGQFRFHPGPIFTGLLLADEINRASPKT